MPRSPVRVVRAGPTLRDSALGRVVGNGDGSEAVGRRFARSAPDFGIELGWVWATLDPSRSRRTARQACLAVPGAGRTLMMFLSKPAPKRRFGDDATQRLELAETIRHACEGFEAEEPDRAGIAQALPEPDELWAMDSLEQAGFRAIATLRYMKLTLPSRLKSPDAWPEGVHVESCTDLSRGSPQRAAVAQAMEASYVDTLDCPELCAMRRTEDVLESHLAVGDLDPSLWFLAWIEDRPVACLLLNPCAAQRSVELVYVGLAPEARGKGLARALLRRGVESVRGLAADELTCAVDVRNAPAQRLYDSLGFRSFATRHAWVRPLGKGAYGV